MYVHTYIHTYVHTNKQTNYGPGSSAYCLGDSEYFTRNDAILTSRTTDFVSLMNKETKNKKQKQKQTQKKRKRRNKDTKRKVEKLRCVFLSLTAYII